MTLISVLVSPWEVVEGKKEEAVWLTRRALSIEACFFPLLLQQIASLR